jgi:hypothetical protein
MAGDHNRVCVRIGFGRHRGSHGNRLFPVDENQRILHQGMGMCGSDQEHPDKDKDRQTVQGHASCLHHKYTSRVIDEIEQQEKAAGNS